MATDAEWIESLKTIDDPKKMLAVIVENETYFGYDPYYRELREAMLDNAERILKAG